MFTYKVGPDFLSEPYVNAIPFRLSDIERRLRHRAILTSRNESYFIYLQKPELNSDSLLSDLDINLHGLHFSHGQGIKATIGCGGELRGRVNVTPMNREDGPIVPDVLDQILRRSPQSTSTTSRTGGGNRLGQLRSELGSPNDQSSEASSLTSAGGRKTEADDGGYKALFNRLHEGFGRLLKAPWVKLSAAATLMKKLDAGEGVCLSPVFLLLTRAQSFF